MTIPPGAHPIFLHEPYHNPVWYHIIPCCATCVPSCAAFLLATYTHLITPLKINGWNMSSWRFGSDHSERWCVGSMLIFQGCNPMKVLMFVEASRNLCCLGSVDSCKKGLDGWGGGLYGFRDLQGVKRWAIWWLDHWMCLLPLWWNMMK